MCGRGVESRPRTGKNVGDSPPYENGKRSGLVQQFAPRTMGVGAGRQPRPSSPRRYAPGIDRRTTWRTRRPLDLPHRKRRMRNRHAQQPAGAARRCHGDAGGRHRGSRFERLPPVVADHHERQPPRPALLSETGFHTGRGLSGFRSGSEETQTGDTRTRLGRHPYPRRDRIRKKPATIRCCVARRFRPDSCVSLASLWYDAVLNVRPELTQLAAPHENHRPAGN